MRIVGLGDSVAHGIGDTGEGFSGPGWSGRLSQGTMALRHLNLSRPGARARDVALGQTPAACLFKPDIALISIGGNDVLREDFDPLEVQIHLENALLQLTAVACDIVVLGLPDPWRTAPMPRLIRAALHRRTKTLNNALHEACKKYNAIFLDTWNDAAIYSPEMWHVDHMHPSSIGYTYLAERVSHRLNIRWHSELVEKGVSQKTPHRILWLLLFGTLWFARRSVDLIPRLTVLALEELRASDSVLKSRNFLTP